MRSLANHSFLIAAGATVALMALTASASPARPLREAALQTTKTVSDGVYTTGQVARGREAYLKECGSCHADNLQGGDEAPGLVGGGFLAQWVDLSIGEFFERIRLTMPQDRPSQLSRSAYVDIIAYIFKVNGFPEGTTELPTDTTALKAITIVAKPQP